MVESHFGIQSYSSSRVWMNLEGQVGATIVPKHTKVDQQKGTSKYVSSINEIEYVIVWICVSITIFKE